MDFVALHCIDSLTFINPRGTIGIVTLWTPIDTIKKTLETAAIDLTPECSHVAVIGNLRGNGFKEFLRNLLYNPQIDTLLVIGSNLTGSYEYIENFFQKGIEPAGRTVEYFPVEGYCPQAARIVGTNFILDDLVSLSSFQNSPNIVRIDSLKEMIAREQLSCFFSDYTPTGNRGERERKNIPIPKEKVQDYPSNPFGHSIVEKTPSDAWRALVHRAYRYGRTVSLAKGERRELLNVKVVIETPVEEEPAVIEACGFSPADFRQYQAEILSPLNKENFSYTYGNRIRSYFGFDSLEKVVSNLKASLDNRQSYISLWDTRLDMEGGSHPCLVSLFFRKIEGMVAMTAIYRTHNVAQAWLSNVYGLMAMQKHVADQAKLTIGPITVISLSISISPNAYGGMKGIHDEFSSKAPIFREDHIGYFEVRVEGKEIVLCHYSEGRTLLGEYRDASPIRLQNQLVRKIATLDLGHAIYLGRQLEKAAHCISEDKIYVQDS